MQSSAVDTEGWRFLASILPPRSPRGNKKANNRAWRREARCEHREVEATRCGNRRERPFCLFFPFFFIVWFVSLRMEALVTTQSSSFSTSRATLDASSPCPPQTEQPTPFWAPKQEKEGGGNRKNGMHIQDRREVQSIPSHPSLSTKRSLRRVIREGPFSSCGGGTPNWFGLSGLSRQVIVQLKTNLSTAAPLQSTVD